VIEDSRLAAFSRELPTIGEQEEEKIEEHLTFLRDQWFANVDAAADVLDEDEIGLGVPGSSVLRRYAPDLLEALPVGATDDRGRRSSQTSG
jgi:hypothetical protein